MQAARGASLSSDDPDSTGTGTSQQAPGPAVGRIGHRRLVLFGGVALTAYVVDQVTKQLAATHLQGQVAKPLVGDLLQLVLVRNPGAAFSTGTGVTPVFTVLSALATVVVIWFGLRARSPLWAVGLGFLLAGVVGNLSDRIVRSPGPFRGHVVDFLMLPNWPVFNVADICINVAAVVIVVQALRGVRLDGRRERDLEEDPMQAPEKDPGKDAR